MIPRSGWADFGERLETVGDIRRPISGPVRFRNSAIVQINSHGRTFIGEDDPMLTASVTVEVARSPAVVRSLHVSASVVKTKAPETGSTRTYLFSITFFTPPTEQSVARYECVRKVT